MSPESQAIVMLASLLGMPKVGGAKPLSPSEFHDLATRCDVGALLGMSCAELEPAVGPEPAERIASLLDRGGSLAVELSRLEDRGIWVLTCADEGFPPRLSERLGAKAPAVLFGAGPVELASQPGLAVVGARNVDEEGDRFASDLGALCAGAGLVVYSGAARGVDASAMGGALQSGGNAVGVLAESLEKSLQRRDLRQAVLDGVLTLLTPFHPASPFTVGNAMSRNKLIYCLADYAVVVAATEDQGGTWAGALENLRAGWTPLFVRAGPTAPPGNAALLARGAIPFEPEHMSSATDLMAGLADLLVSFVPPPPAQAGLFSDS